MRCPECNKGDVVDTDLFPGYSWTCTNGWKHSSGPAVDALKGCDPRSDPSASCGAGWCASCWGAILSNSFYTNHQGIPLPKSYTGIDSVLRHPPQTKVIASGNMMPADSDFHKAKTSVPICFCPITAFGVVVQEDCTYDHGEG